jgi:glycerol-3-phosphate acyltransferase PlsY
MSPLSSFMTLMVAGLWHWPLIAFALGYLLGSIPFGLVLTKWAGLGDVRAIGSGNIGATNVLRTGNKGLAAATLLLDGLKGAAAVLIADHFYGQVPAMLAGFGAFLGHIYPVWLKFRGGKGVATFLGVLAAIAWPAGALFAVIWLVVALTTRYSSLAALTATACAPALLYGFGQLEAAVLTLAMALIIFWKHRANIRRLVAGEETRIGDKTASV